MTETRTSEGERFPKVVRREDDTRGGEGHFAVWIAMSDERGDLIHLDFNSPVSDADAIGCAEYAREIAEARSKLSDTEEAG